MNLDNISINQNASLQDALIKLDAIPNILTLFVTDDDEKVLGSVTDGDIRRGFINNLNRETKIFEFTNKEFVFLKKGEVAPDKIKFIKSKRIKIVPILNEDKPLFNYVNFNKVKSLLPLDAVIMAGGKGTRLLPLTKDIPKPLLQLGKQPIIDYNVDLLNTYGINNLTVSVNHYADQIINHFEKKELENLKVDFVNEDTPLGTIGAIKKIKEFHHDYVLVMNSDLLTNIDLDAMFELLISQEAEMVVATTEYKVQIPYGVIETNGDNITKLKEKPSYTYYSNAGIYLIKKNVLDYIPEEEVFNATDLMEELIKRKQKLIHFPIKGYWLDIGKHVDFEKAQKDIKTLNLSK
jgi:dTDP-glucose pyrophosphorylase